jgi:hypothetical protein
MSALRDTDELLAMNEYFDTLRRSGEWSERDFFANVRVVNVRVARDSAWKYGREPAGIRSRVWGKEAPLRLEQARVTALPPCSCVPFMTKP